MGIRFFDREIDCDQIGKYVLLPGDPGRVLNITELLDDVSLVLSEDEHLIYSGYYAGIKISVASTGIGGPPTALMVTKLASLGATHFIRIGGAGGLQHRVKLGDLVIATGAIRDEGAGSTYLPLAYPAVADFEVIGALVAAALRLDVPHHVGIVHSKDSFKSQVAPQNLPWKHGLEWNWESWLTAGALASEMEAAALYITGQVLGVRTGSIFLVRHSKDHSSKAVTENFVPAIRTALDAFRLLDSQNR